MLRLCRSKIVPGLLGIFLLASCDYSEVSVGQISAIKVTEFNQKGVVIQGSVHVVNPNNYPIKITGSDADLFLEGRKAGKAKLVETITIPAHFADELTAKIRADFERENNGILPLLLGASVKRKLNIRVSGTVKAKSFLIGKRVDFDHTHEAKF